MFLNIQYIEFNLIPCEWSANQSTGFNEPGTICGRTHFEGARRIIPTSFLIFKVIKVPAGSDFKVSSPNFKFSRRKIWCRGGGGLAPRHPACLLDSSPFS